MALINNYFKGIIDGYKAGDFAKMLSKDINTQKERIELVKEICDKGEKFFDIYFEQDPELTTKPMWNLLPNCSQPLSDNSPIVKELEILTNYILFAPDGERMNKKQAYNFYTEKEFNKICNKEFGISISSTDEDVIDFLIRKGTNYKKETKQELYARDYKDKELECLIPYKNEIMRLHKEVNFLRETGGDKKRIGLLCRHMKSMKEDQIYLKNIIKCPIYFKSPLPDEGEYDWDEFLDWNNKEHVIALLRVDNKPITTDLGAILYDLDNLIYKCNFDKSEKDILNWLKNSDIPKKTMASMLGISRPTFDSMIDRVAFKIIDIYNNIYMDNYYLNIEKGTYENCSKCGEVLLKNDKNIVKNKIICEKCRKI